jgi:hypothetical protein
MEQSGDIAVSFRYRGFRGFLRKNLLAASCSILLLTGADHASAEYVKHPRGGRKGRVLFLGPKR